MLLLVISMSNKHIIRMKQAELSAGRSKCVSHKVGCVVCLEERIVSEGYNGTPMGYVNCDVHFNGNHTEEHHEWSNTHEIHAEQNAIIWAARKGISIEGGTIYCTHKPCLHCTKMIIASGIKEIYYKHEYHRNSDEVLNSFLNACAVKITKLEF